MRDVVLLTLFICVALAAQIPPQKPAPGVTPAALVLPIPGAPVFAEIVEERITKLPDGTSKSKVLRSKAYRDIAGRMRIEMDLGDADGPTAFIQIVDPQAGFMAILIPSEKTAARLQFPKEAQAQPGVSFFGVDPLVSVQGKKTHKSEALGKQTIDGIEYDGARNTTTVDDQPSILGVQETWIAKDVGLIGLSKTSSPDLESTAKLKNVDRHDPDPALFLIPPDYSIQELLP